MGLQEPPRVSGPGPWWYCREGKAWQSNTVYEAGLLGKAYVLMYKNPGPAPQGIALCPEWDTSCSAVPPIPLLLTEVLEMIHTGFSYPKNAVLNQWQLS